MAGKYPEFPVIINHLIAEINDFTIPAFLNVFRLFQSLSRSLRGNSLSFNTIVISTSDSADITGHSGGLETGNESRSRAQSEGSSRSRNQRRSDARAEDYEGRLRSKQFISELHADCDWLISNYDSRKESRTNEIEALKKAKAVLSGA